MLTVIAENAFLVVIILGFISATCIFAGLKSGSRNALIIGAVFLLLIPVEVVVEQQWVTERERVHEVIMRVAQHLENEQYDEVYRDISATAGGALAQAKAELPRYTFESARVTGIKQILVREDLNPPQAFADFSVAVYVSGNFVGTSFKNQFAARRVRVAFEKQDGRWLIIGYEHMPLVGGRDGYDQFGTGGQMPSWIPAK